MMKDGVAFQPLVALSKLIKAKQLSPLELTTRMLARIRKHDVDLASFVHVNDNALADAEMLETELSRGRWRGPLHGIPIAIKDNYFTSDMPTTAGTKADVSFPNVDSAVVAKLRDAGAVLIGKTRTHEFAWGNTTPPTKNPWDFGRIPGGSSGGSAAAVAGGLATASMGSDTGGSIRIPASFCGLVGLKPTFGSISRYGIVPHSWSLDHAGPLTRCVEDARIMHGILSGSDSRDPGSMRRNHPTPTGTEPGVEGMRIAVIRNHFFGHNQTDVETSVETAINWFRANGATVVDVELPNLSFALGAIFAIELSSSTAYHDMSLQNGRSDAFSKEVKLLVQMGRLVSGADMVKAEQFRRVLMQDFKYIFDKCDVVVGPTEPITAPHIGAETVTVGSETESALAATWRLTYPYNLVGLPALTLPCGFDQAGLPIGLQIAARPFDEFSIFRAAACYENAHNWVEAVPARLQ